MDYLDWENPTPEMIDDTHRRARQIRKRNMEHLRNSNPRQTYHEFEKPETDTLGMLETMDIEVI